MMIFGKYFYFVGEADEKIIIGSSIKLSKDVFDIPCCGKIIMRVQF